MEKKPEEQGSPGPEPQENRRGNNSLLIALILAGLVALLFFNIGVELGQLGFVALILVILRSFQILEIHWPRWSESLPAYTVGTLGAFWAIQRTVAICAGIWISHR